MRLQHFKMKESGLNRFFAKGRTSFFQPVQSKHAFLNDQSKELTHELMEEFGQLAVSHMLDELEEADPELLEKLEQKINHLKKGK
jgi:predicted transcriptional regulator